VVVSRISVCGLGAVSPAGWGIAALRAALESASPLPLQSLARPGTEPLPIRLVPPLPTRPSFLTHPRLRRASALTHYGTAAALESLAWLPADQRLRVRCGLVVCLQAGCAQYPCRFFEETMRDPATASPLLFPETVFAALASHLASLLENVPLACTLVGDPATFSHGLALAADWLEDGRVDTCIVLGAEEPHWISAEALRCFERSSVLASGAGALCLSRDAGGPLGVDLDRITDAHTYTANRSRGQAAHDMRSQLPGSSANELLCDGISGAARLDAAEAAAWQDWNAARISPKRTLGEGLMASAAWQCVAACDALASDRFAAANISLVGSNQQAIGARFIRGPATARDETLSETLSETFNRGST
jgi:3-oxoacyl-(acyl-carrier-protein) synthase